MNKTYELKGKSIAVIGFGRSGLAVALAAKSRGANVIVVDQNHEERLSKPELLGPLHDSKIEIYFGWNGTLKSDFDLAVLNPAIPYHWELENQLKDAGIALWSEVEFAYRISKAPIVAITGTNGKSTTTAMTYQILKGCGENAVLCGNIFGTGFEEKTLTQAADEANEDSVLVAEISSAQLERIDQFHPVVAGITNITQDHSDRYTTFAEYASMKFRILENSGPEDWVVINEEIVNDAGPVWGLYQSQRKTEKESSANQLNFGPKGTSAYEDGELIHLLDKTIHKKELSVYGHHNYLNAEMATLIAYSYLSWRSKNQPNSKAAVMLNEARKSLRTNIKTDALVNVLPIECLKGLKEFAGIKYRMSYLGECNQITFIDNSMCTNPAALVNSLSSLTHKGHVLVGGVTKGADFEIVKEFLSKHFFNFYLYGRDRQLLQHQLGGGFQEFETLGEAFFAAVKCALPFEIVILSPGCASQDQFRDFKHRGNVFRELVADFFAGNGQGDKLRSEKVSTDDVQNGAQKIGKGMTF